MSHHGRLFECTISKDCSGLQTAIEEFLSPKKVWFRVEKKLHEPSRRYHTNVKVELSVELNIFQLLNELKSALIDQFSELSEEDIVWTVTEDGVPTPPAETKRKNQPSEKNELSDLEDGFDDLAPDDSLSQGGSMSSSVFMKAMEVGLSLLQLNGEITFEKAVVTIEATNGHCALFDVTEMSGLSMESFLAKITSSKDLDLKAPAKKLYSRDSDGLYCIISTVSCLRDKHKYYVFTELDKLPVNPPLEYNTGNQEVSNAKTVNFSSMDEFYEALRANRYPDKYIKVISDAFDKHDIDHVNLPNLTDDKLKEIGLLIGYRTEILHVLGKKF